MWGRLRTPPQALEAIPVNLNLNCVCKGDRRVRGVLEGPSVGEEAGPCGVKAREERARGGEKKLQDEKALGDVLLPSVGR